MRWPGSQRVHGLVAGGIGGVLAALGHAWVWDVAPWEPVRLGLAIAVGAGVGLLCARFRQSNDS